MQGRSSNAPPCFIALLWYVSYLLGRRAARGAASTLPKLTDGVHISEAAAAVSCQWNPRGAAAGPRWGKALDIWLLWRWHVRRKVVCTSVWDHCSDSVENPTEMIYATLAVLHKLARELL